jgi:hypothetical protein
MNRAQKKLIQQGDITLEKAREKLDELLVEHVGEIRESFAQRIIRRTPNCQQFDGKLLLQIPESVDHTAFIKLNAQEEEALRIMELESSK